MRKKADRSRTLVFIAIATCFMVLIDRVFQPVRTVPTDAVVIEQGQPVIAQPEPQITKPDFAPPLEFSMGEPMLPPEENIAPEEDVTDEAVQVDAPLWMRNAVASTAPKDKPRVVIIIDDMGMDRVHTREAMTLPAPITFAFLPYAGDLKTQTDAARAKGHELIVHVPMEPMNSTLNAGPEVLRPAMPPEEFMKILNDDLSAFDGYVGINNHMGSKMTQDREGMKRVMGVLRSKGLLFVDSKTIGSSVAEDEAKKAGIPYAGRDVFLDHDETYEAVSGALAQTEREALKTGLAIAIGHPKPETIRALREWLPTLAGKGIYLVPISAAVTIPAAKVAPTLPENVSMPAAD